MSYAYIDSSVLLRIVLKEAGKLSSIKSYTKCYSSCLLKTECMRALNRQLLARQLSEDSYATIYQRLRFALHGMSLISLNERILNLAEENYIVPLGTLDAIHLATALELREHLKDPSLALITHDHQLAKAALTQGMTVLGV